MNKIIHMLINLNNFYVFNMRENSTKPPVSFDQDILSWFNGILYGFPTVT